MAWTTPRTWVTGELVTATIMNTHIRDNLNALKAPPTDSHVVNEASDYTTTSTSFVDVDATDLALTITTTGGDVLVHFHGSVYRNGGSSRMVFLDVDVDGARTAGDDGIVATMADTDLKPHAIGFTRYISGLSAGSHTFKLQWKVDGAALMSSGAGTANNDLHPQFWVREVS